MKLAPCPLRRNVVSANPASPSGAGSAAGTLSMRVGVGRTSATVAIATPLSRPPVREARAGLPTDNDRPSCAFFRETRKVKRAGSGRQVVRVPRQVLGAARGDEEEVLEPHAAEAGPVEAGLGGDDVARAQGVLRRQPEARLLVDLEADAVAEPVEEALVERRALLLRPPRRQP